MRACLENSKLYDEVEACYRYEVYEVLRDTDEAQHRLSELLESLEPLVNTVCSLEISRSVCDFNFEVIKFEALEALFFIFREGIREIPFDTPRRFTRFMWSTIRNEIYKSASHNADMITFEVEQAYGSDACPQIYGSSLSYKDADNKFRLQEYKRDTLLYAKAKVRFVGVEKEACYKILSLMATKKSVDLSVVSALYKINRDITCFLVQYCKYLLRRARYLLGAQLVFE